MGDSGFMNITPSEAWYLLGAVAPKMLDSNENAEYAKGATAELGEAIVRCADYDMPSCHIHVRLPEIVVMLAVAKASDRDADGPVGATVILKLIRARIAIEGPPPIPLAASGDRSYSEATGDRNWEAAS